MIKFAEELIEVKNAVDHYYKLIVNGKCLIDEFWAETKKSGNLEIDLDRTQKIIEDLSQGKEVPAGTIKELKGRPKNDKIKDYEIRGKRIRLYFVKNIKGKILIIGGVKDKKKQIEQIKRMRGIKKRYFEFIENTEIKKKR